MMFELLVQYFSPIPPPPLPKKKQFREDNRNPMHTTSNVVYKIIGPPKCQTKQLSGQRSYPIKYGNYSAFEWLTHYINAAETAIYTVNQFLGEY